MAASSTHLARILRELSWELVNNTIEVKHQHPLVAIRWLSSRFRNKESLANEFLHTTGFRLLWCSLNPLRHSQHWFYYLQLTQIGKISPRSLRVWNRRGEVDYCFGNRAEANEIAKQLRQGRQTRVKPHTAPFTWHRPRSPWSHSEW